ncbi:hypothetical protein EON65_48580 [archaeon]|nr:MAG: hypothetical protein EON65_48580 [archaeon]
MSITNGVSDIVLEKIGDARIPVIVVEGTGEAGRVVAQDHEWDSGYFSHDLYLVYHITVDCKKTVLSASWIFGGIMNCFNASAAVVRNKLGDTFREWL